MRAGVTRGSRTPERVQQRDEVIGHEADPKQRVEERHHHVDVDDDQVDPVDRRLNLDPGDAGTNVPGVDPRSTDPGRHQYGAAGRRIVVRRRLRPSMPQRAEGAEFGGADADALRKQRIFAGARRRLQLRARSRIRQLR